MFVNKKGEGVTELHDEKWLWDLTLLCDITHHTGYSNTKLKGQHKSTHISDMFRAV
jgi:hypothetical protein